jgi:hypothetical protein
MSFSNTTNAKNPSACTTQHSPDVQARGNGTKRGDKENNRRLHNAVLEIRVFGAKFEVFFEGLDHNCNNHIDDHKHDQEYEEVMPKVSGVGVDEELLVKVTRAKKCAWEIK